MKSIVQVVQNLIQPYIDNHDKANANLIAPVEVSPAEAAHSAGTQLIYNGKLYDVTAPIAIGDALATTGAGANISLSNDISTLLKNIKADYVGLYGEVEIDSATDLNTMQTIGNYYKAATDFAVTNAPTGVAGDIQARFRLTVEKVLDSADSIVMQILTAITGESSNVHKEVIEKVISFSNSIGFGVKALSFSPIKGPEGNIEFLVYLYKGENKFYDINEVVMQASTLK